MGDVENIIYRSSLELRLMRHLDEHPEVKHWNSEEIVIPYIKPTDGKVHRYFVDMAAIRERNGQRKTFLIEVKPYDECFPPKNPKTRKQQARYLAEALTYEVNQAKWKAAREFCAGRGWEFVVMTERELRY